MVNLYQILNLSYLASEGEIRSALLGKKEFLDRETIDAVNKWLLVETVRPRYDAALRRRFPEFFRLPEIRTPQPPELWNPQTAAVLSLVLSPAFGAWIHAENWRILGNEKRAQQNICMLWATAVCVVTNVLLVLFGYIDLPFWLVLWVVWFVWLGWRQIVFVRTAVGGYLPKGWMRPVAWVFVMFAGIVLILCIGFILGGLIPVGAA